MSKEIKALLFSAFTSIFGFSFIAQWISTGSIYKAIYFVGQLTLIFTLTPLTVGILFWIGTKIFHDN